MNRRDFNHAMLAAAGGYVIAPRQMGSTVRVNGGRFVEHLNGLSQFGKNPQGGVSRVAYSEADLLGREYVMGLMRGAGLEVKVDASGYLVGRRSGRDPALKPLRARSRHLAHRFPAPRLVQRHRCGF